MKDDQLHILGIALVGVNAQNASKLLLSVVLIAAILAMSAALRALVSVLLIRGRGNEQRRFWTRQVVSLSATVILILGLLSIWFNDPTRLATALSLVSAGLAFALQQPVTSIASYFVILRGSTFTVGDRISMGGVRGDVLHLGFIQTTIMEMGEPPAVQSAEPAVWVKSRQFTGRIVTVSNSKIFAEPVFNYTRDFPFIWEEIAIPITYKADRGRMEQILLDAAAEHAVSLASIPENLRRTLSSRFHIEEADIFPAVFYRLTDNWLELTVRFLVHTHHIRRTKNLMSRAIIEAMDGAGIEIASSTYDIVGFPPIRMAPPPDGKQPLSAM